MDLNRIEEGSSRRRRMVRKRRKSGVEMSRRRGRQRGGEKEGKFEWRGA